MCLFRLRPEIWDGEFSVEVRAKVVHPSDRKENVKTELRYGMSDNSVEESEDLCITHLEDFEIRTAHSERGVNLELVAAIVFASSRTSRSR